MRTTARTLRCGRSATFGLDDYRLGERSESASQAADSASCTHTEKSTQATQASCAQPYLARILGRLRSRAHCAALSSTLSPPLSNNFLQLCLTSLIYETKKCCGMHAFQFQFQNAYAMILMIRVRKLRIRKFPKPERARSFSLVAPSSLFDLGNMALRGREYVMISTY